MIKRLGVLTGGGDCPGLNAVLRGVVKTAIMKYGYDVIGFRDSYKGMVLNNTVELNTDDVSGIIDKGGTILGTSNRHNPFKFLDKAEGYRKEEDLSDVAVKNVMSHGIDCMIMIGGDGTLTSARDFARKGLPVIGVPKTIDNDLSATDITFGFMTAVNTATDAVDKLHTTAEAHQRVMILEVMGRNAGWIAIKAGIAGGADIILIPEIPYDIKLVAQKIIERRKQGKLYSIVVVSEGAKPIGGDVVVNKIVKDSPDPIKLGGIGNKVADDLDELTGVETRVTVLGHLQRGGTPIPYDRILSTRYGVEAVEMFNRKEFGKMVSLKGDTITSVSLEKAVEKIKTVDPDGEMVRIAKSVGVGFGDEKVC
mgnify:CR=1 FL=1